MNWATAITTAPRSEYYLPETIASLSAAGWDKPTIFAEPDSPVPMGCQVVDAETKQGSWPNFLRALGTMIEWRPNADWYAVFQDDILIAENCRAWLEPQLPPDGIVSLYCSGKTSEGRQPGWFQIEQGIAARRAYGALAVLFPAVLAKMLVTERPGRGSLTKTDIHIGRFCDKHEISYWYHTPSLVRHVGHVSAIKHVPGEKMPRSERPWSDFRHETEWVSDCGAFN